MGASLHQICASSIATYSIAVASAGDAAAAGRKNMTLCLMDSDFWHFSFNAGFYDISVVLEFKLIAWHVPT